MPSGFNKRNNHSYPAIPGDPMRPVTVAELNDAIRHFNDLSSKMQVARVGFQAATRTSTSIGGVVTDSVVQFTEMVDDTSRFAKTVMASDRKYFQVPPGCGGMYHLSWGMAFDVTTTVVTNYAKTGAVQTFTVPAGVTSIQIELWGASGGPGSAAPASAGGLGGYSKGTLAVTAGQVYNIYVGGLGTNPGGAHDSYNGGGPSASPGGSAVGEGGGSTDVRFGGIALANRIMVAGGGGGGGGGFAGGGGNSDGGHGGGANLPGTRGLCLGVSQTTDGYPGITSGAGAAGFNTETIAPTAGALFQGGTGCSSGVTLGGGGGGGGYYAGGGGGGVRATPSYGGGGGGSGYASGFTSVSGSTGIWSGAGKARVTYTTHAAAAATDVSGKVWASYAKRDTYAAYGLTEVVSADSGLSPLGKSIHLPLGEGDRVWMTVTNTNAIMSYSNVSLGAYIVNQAQAVKQIGT